jgi:hypothetical protein
MGQAGTKVGASHLLDRITAGEYLFSQTSAIGDVLRCVPEAMQSKQIFLTKERFTCAKNLLVNFTDFALQVIIGIRRPLSEEEEDSAEIVCRPHSFSDLISLLHACLQPGLSENECKSINCGCFIPLLHPLSYHYPLHFTATLIFLH